MGVRLAVLSTYPSTQCGIATFAQSLVTHLTRGGAHVGVVRIVDEREEQVLPVVHQWVRGSAHSAEDTARVLDGYDAVLVQHEYGIFGGEDGQDVLDVVDRLQVPVISVLHTVLTHPTAGQHRVLDALIRASDALVTMTRTAHDRLLAGWDVDPGIVSVIPHGADDNRRASRWAGPVLPARPTILTWGLLSEGKGIEWALRALAELGPQVARPRYRVVGRTHPRVLEREGEAYRNRLLALTHDLGLDDVVEFDDHYLSADELRQEIRSADIVLLPYDSLEQVTSGVLTEAVAAGKPVISTSFPHAVELLSSGAGLLVPQRDPAAMAAALTRVLTIGGVAERMANQSHRLATSLLWPAVAERYIGLARVLASTPQRSAG